MLVLTRSEIAGLLDVRGCVGPLETALAHWDANALDPHRVTVPNGDGAFHVTLGGERDGLLSLKVNGRFPPRLSGAVLLCDAASGVPLALLDSLQLTMVRTAAMAQIAIRRLGWSLDSVLLVGAGALGARIVEALAGLPDVGRLAVADAQPAARATLAAAAVTAGLDATAVATPEAALETASVVITATPAVAPLFAADAVAPGTLIVALGADAPGKQELDPALFRRGHVVVDVLAQAARAGDLQHALAAGTVATHNRISTLTDVVAGRVSRPDATRPIVFDATGTGLQDAVAGALILAAASRAGRGSTVELAG